MVFDANLCSKGIVLANTGAEYAQTGKRANTTGWQHETIAPGGMFTVEHQHNLVRVYSPVTGQSWAFAAPGELLGGDATSDGQYALAWYRKRLGNNLRRMLARVPQIAPFFSHDVLALYQRPGHLRAELPIDIHAWWNQATAPENWWEYPSPDGHAVAFNIAGSPGCTCLLFRW